MAERINFYADQDTAQTITSGTFGDITLNNPILGVNLTGSNKYLIIARALIGVDSVTNKGFFRVETPDDTDIEALSEDITEYGQTGATDLKSFFFVRSFTTAATPSDVNLQFKVDGSSTMTADQMSLDLLDLTAIGESGYWDGTVTDDEAVWTNDANIVDGNKSTSAFTNTSGSSTSNEIRIANNQHPTTGDVSEPVCLNIFGDSDGADSDNLGFAVFDGATELISGTWTAPDVTTAAVNWSPPFLIPAPAGGWTAVKMEGLQVAIWRNAGNDELRVARVDFTTGYAEHQRDAAAQVEYSTTAATTELAQITGEVMGTDEHWILGSAMAEVGSTGRWFDIALHAAVDASSSAEVAKHRAEGEDTGEQRIVGFSVRHKASSGTPAVTLYGQEEAASGNMIDGGAYLIALPAALFADFEHDYTAGSVRVDTETTVATITFTPSVNGNHLIFGSVQDSVHSAAALTKLHLEDGTTETRTGDSTPSHTQRWDSDKDREGSRTFERISISAQKTYNLRATRGSFDEVEDRWLIVVNLNEPAAPAAVYPPFPRRQRTTVRM